MDLDGFVRKATSLDESQEEVILRLVSLRSQYPEIGTERWGWARLGEQVCANHPTEVASVIIDLVGDFRCS